jgi:serine/threonine protein kinase
LHTHDDPTLPLPVRRSGNALPDGTHLAEFEIRATVGEGGFGIVYMAWDGVLKRQVAIKEYVPWSLAGRVGSRVVPSSESAVGTFELGLRSFINEAQLLARFDHPSLLKVYRFWEDNGTAYMVMPFYRGITLKRALSKLGAAPEESWLTQQLGHLLDALEVMHEASCFHRDIAPDNILLLDEGIPLLLDFGAARRVVGDRSQTLTAFLKPGYAPVEQYAAMPDMTQGPWTDLYALASVVHYAITGHTPPESVARLVSDTAVPLARAAAGRYGDAFLRAIDHALRVRPEQRPQSVAQMRAELGLPPPKQPALKTGAIPTAPQSFDSRPAPLDDVTVPPSARQRASPRVPAAATGVAGAAAGRQRWVAGVAGASGLVALAALGWWVLQPPAPAIPPTVAPAAVAPAAGTAPSNAMPAEPASPGATAGGEAVVATPTPAGAAAAEVPADEGPSSATQRSSPGTTLPTPPGSATLSPARPPKGAVEAPARSVVPARPDRSTPRLNSTDSRCADIIARVSLGEVPTAAERALLQGECRR